MNLKILLPILAFLIIIIGIPNAFSLASFVDPEKDPWSYVERYRIELEYKEWFDNNFPGYTIFEAIGIPEIIKEKIPYNAYYVELKSFFA